MSLAAPVSRVDSSTCVMANSLLISYLTGCLCMARRLPLSSVSHPFGGRRDMKRLGLVFGIVGAIAVLGVSACTTRTSTAAAPLASPSAVMVNSTLIDCGT